MDEYGWAEPNTEEAEVDEETLAALDAAIEAADRGEWYTQEEVREMMAKWLSKSVTPNSR